MFLLTACTEAEEDLEKDQLSCTKERDETYFPDTESYSSVSSDTDGALSDSESNELFVFNCVIKFQLIFFPRAYSNNEHVTMSKMSCDLNYK